MKTYVDSNALVPIYVPERFSRAARAAIQAAGQDLLHVAAAHADGCTAFVSADDRQMRLARATGLKIVDIRRRVSRRT